MKSWKKAVSLGAAAALAVGMTATLAGCGETATTTLSDPKTETSSGAQSASVDTTNKVINYGINYSSEQGIDPQVDYNGWYTVRFGVGETLVKLADTGELEPWVAERWSRDGSTWTIQLKSGVTFSNGKAVDAEAVKACLERLIEQHPRAAGDLMIKSMTADGLTLTIETDGENYTLINSMADPYASIIDVSCGVDAKTNVVGTGPYKLIECTGEGTYVEKNDNYWNGTPKVERINFISFSDPDTLGMALQNGDIDAAYGLTGTVYVDLIRKTEGFKVSQVDTSTRNISVFFDTADGFTADPAVRQAVAMSIDKDSFVEVAMRGDAEAATSAFPATFAYGDGKVTAPTFDLDGAKKVLEKAGYTDSDGDGYLDKDGEKLSLKWVVYSSEDSLSKLVEITQANLKEIGVEIIPEIVESMGPRLQEGNFDLFATVYTSAANGDPQYYYTNYFAEDGGYSYTNWKNNEFDDLLAQLKAESDPDKRGKISIQLEQLILDNYVTVNVGHKKSAVLMKEGITGLDASMSDFYITTIDADIN